MNRLREKREAAKLTQTALAVLAGVTQQSIHYAENGTDPRVANGIRMARALGTTVEDLFGDSVPPLDERSRRIAELTRELAELRAQKGGAR